MRDDVRIGAATRAPLLAAELPAQGGWAWFVYVMIFLGLAAVDYYAVSGISRQVTALVEHHRALRLLVYPSLLWVLMGSVLILFRTCVWMFYRPMAPAAFISAPSLTVVIPAYNEGAMVLQSIESVVAADYPRDRLEIVVIDDGSSVVSFAQAGGSLLQGLRPVRFLTRGGLQRLSALWTAG
jgi:hyaluronan synthase